MVIKNLIGGFIHILRELEDNEIMEERKEDTNWEKIVKNDKKYKLKNKEVKQK